MTPFGRYLLDHRWKLLFTTQGVFTCIIMYNRFNKEPPLPIAKASPSLQQQAPRHQDQTNAQAQRSGRDEAAQLHQLSIGRLLQTVSAGRGDGDVARELRESWRLERVELHASAACQASREIIERFGAKRARRDEFVASAAVGASACKQALYVSHNVWLIGFLRFPDNASTASSGLHLCDANAHAHALLLNPRPEYVGQLVLIKKWTLVDIAVGTTRTRSDRFFLEVHDQPTILHQSNTAREPLSQLEAMKLLETHYPSKEPPLYTGTRPWRAVADTEASNGAIALAMLPLPGKGKAKKKKVHAVCGRLLCVSPVSNQHDRLSCHYFVEVEYQHFEGAARVQSVVSIMFVGAQHLRWRVFLQPGVQVLVTDLTKVFSRECGIFLLQTTIADRLNNDQTLLDTEVFVWHDNRVDTQRILPQIYSPPDPLSNAPSDHSFHCEGIVAGIAWNDCLELHGDPGFVVCLFHFPSVDLERIRHGATIRILNAHVIRWPHPAGGKIVLGLCSRSHFSVTGHAGLSGPCLKMPSLASSSNRPPNKKLSYLGDRHTQPLTLSVRLFELFEALVSKFSFGSSSSVVSSMRLSATSFPHVRRREALRIVTEAFGIDNHSPSSRNLTLGSRFLNSYQDGTSHCSSVEYSPGTKPLPHAHFITIKELQKWAQSHIVAATEDKSTKDHFPVAHVPPKDLKWCLLFGCIKGNIHSGDLEICDRTGSLPLCIRNGSQTQGLHLGPDKCVYLIRQFELRVESLADTAIMRQDADGQLLLCTVVCSISDIEIIPMDNSVVSIQKTNEAVAELSVFVTDVGSVNQSSVMLRPSQPVYRHVRGIALPVGPFNSAGESVEQAPNRVELLIRSDCPHWHVEKYGLYKITGAKLDGDQSANPGQSPSAPMTTEERCIMLVAALLTKLRLDNKLEVVCFDNVANLVHEFDPPELGMRSPALKLYRIEGSNEIHPLAVHVNLDAHSCPHNHESCVRLHVDQKGLLDLSRPCQSSTSFATDQLRLHSHLLDLAREKIQVPLQTLILCSLVQYFVQRAEHVVHVKDLMCHPRSEDLQQERADKQEKKPSTNGSINSIEHQDIHKKRLISIIGVIIDKRYDWVEKSHHATDHSAVSLDAPGKRTLQGAGNPLERNKNHDLMCRYRLRSLFSADTIEIAVNVSKFGAQPTIQKHSVVEFSNLLRFIARANYKMYMTWGNSTSVRALRRASVVCEIPSDAEVYGVMQTSRLNDLYRSHLIDRALRKWVVRVVYVSYVVLKRKCRACHQALHFEKHRASWVHQPSFPSKKPHKCSWHQVQQKDPRFREITAASLSMRCIIDDGSAQAELFLENDVVWELLACSAGSKRRFEDMISSNTSELSYFTGQSAANLFPSAHAKDDEYYQNEFRSMVVCAMQRLRHVVVFGQRFYTSAHKHQQSGNRSSGAPEGEVVSVLMFSKDIQITTTTVANAQLEARRVDPLHVKSELRQRLARSLQSCPPPS